MKNTKKIIGAVVVICGAAMSLLASPVDMMIGARGYGFGGAYAAIVDDPSAAYWNPAALSQVDKMSLMESNWVFQQVEGLNVNYLNFTLPLPNVGTVSGGWLMQYAGLEQEEPGSLGATMETNSSFEHQLSLSIGRKLWDELLVFRETSIGFSVNRYAYMTSVDKESGLGIDLGAFTKFPYGISVALVGRSLLSDVGGAALDPEARLGVGYTITLEEMHKLTAALDGAYKMNRDYLDSATFDPASHNMKYFGGAEYALLYEGWELAVRGGGNGILFNTLKSWGFTAGIGVSYGGYSVQYAFKGDTDPDVGLGYSHRADLVLQLANLGR